MQDKIKFKIFTVEELLPENRDTNQTYDPTVKSSGSDVKYYTQEETQTAPLTKLLTAQDLADGSITSAKIREITADKIISGIVRVGMYMESADYDLVTKKGWRISAGENGADSYINIANGDFWGRLRAGAAIIGKILMGQPGQPNGIIEMDHTPGNGDSALMINKTLFNHSQVGIIAGIDDTDQLSKLYIDSEANHFAFNGRDVELQGLVIASAQIKTAIYQVSGLPIPQAQVGFNAPTTTN